MGLEILTPQSALASVAVIFSFVGFTGLLIMDLQGGPTITTFTADLTDSNGDGKANPNENVNLACAATDINGLDNIVLTITSPDGSSSNQGSGGQAGGVTSFTYPTFTTSLSQTGAYTFVCTAKNVNGTSSTSSKTLVVSTSTAVCNPISLSSEGCKDPSSCASAGGKWCMGGPFLNSYCDASSAACTSNSGACGNGICDKGESGTPSAPQSNMCAQDCGGSSPSASSSQSSCNVDPSQYKTENTCKSVGCTWCSQESACRASGSSCASSASTQSCNENGKCDLGEFETTCSIDCGVSSGYASGCGTGKCGDGKCNINCNIQETWNICYKDCAKSGGDQISSITNAGTTPLAITGTSPKPIASPKPASPTPVQLKPGQPTINSLDFDNPNAVVGDTVKSSCMATDSEGLVEINITLTNPSGKASTKASTFANTKSGAASISSYKILEEGTYILECQVADSDNNLQTDIKQIEIVSNVPQIIHEAKSGLKSSPTILRSEILQMPELIEKSVPVQVEISKGVAEELGATKITLEVLKDVKGASIEINALDSIPETDEGGQALTELPLVEQPVIKVMQFITSPNLSQSLKQAEIEFALTDAEMLENNLVPDEVALARFESGVWVELETFYLGKSDNSGNHRFKSTTPGFSVFVVTKKASSIQIPNEGKKGSELTKERLSADLSCSHDSECGWYSLNGCSQDSGAIWRCGNSESATSLAEQLSESGSCSNIFVPKPKPETCGCVENSCKRVDVQLAEKSILKSDLLDALLTVEQFKARFEYLSKASAKVGKYYQSTNKKEKASVWIETSGDLIKGVDSLENVRVKIKSVKDAPTKSDIDAITREIDIVVKLLSIDELRIKRMLSD